MNWKQAGVIDMIIETNAACLTECGKILFLTEAEDRPAKIQEVKDGIVCDLLTICESQL